VGDGVRFASGQGVENGCLAALGQAYYADVNTHQCDTWLPAVVILSAAFLDYITGFLKSQVPFVDIEFIVCGQVQQDE